jgi:riboflavin kinase/FMN adenylyltransferase
LKIHKDIKDIRIEQPVLTMGTFDGLHIGHLHVLDQLKKKAQAANGQSVILTFWPHPKMVLGSGNVKLLNTIEEKISLFERNDIDHLIIIEFTKELADLHYQEFAKEILIKNIGIKHLIFGYDHRFGKNGEGTFDKLISLSKQYNFDLHKLDEVRIGHAVSSTRIRHSISNGHVNEASKMLGYPYQLKGKVIKGEQIGRKIGFPTANLDIMCPYKLIPGNGVYACKAYLNGKAMPAMMNIGVKPTINNKNEQTIEVHLIDFSDNLYDSEMRVELIQRIREEMKFPSLKELSLQITEDKKTALTILK